MDFQQKITPDNITELKEDEIFVFGSNESGRHGKGAAKTAMKWGAIYGQASGIQGQTYGIPTKNASISKTLPLDKIAFYVHKFTIFAQKQSDLKFFVTEIGCGLAGLTPKEVAPLFEEASRLPNVYLPKRFWHKLKG
jgi:hypothetical protein